MNLLVASLNYGNQKTKMNNTQPLAHAVEDGQPDPLNSYHEICRQALADMYGEPDLYNSLTEDVKDLLRKTAKEALDPPGPLPLPGSPLLPLRAHLVDWVFSNVKRNPLTTV